MPWICTFYNPSSAFSTATQLVLLFLTFTTDVRYVPSLDSRILNLLEIVSFFVKAQVLPPVFPSWSFDYYIWSSVSIAAFMSWVLAAVTTTDNGMPFWSVRTCLFVPSLLPLSVGLWPVLSPLTVPWQTHCQAIAISILFHVYHRISSITWPIASERLLNRPTPETSDGR